MKIGKTLALTLGLAAGAVITVVVSGRNGKKVRPYTPSLLNGKPGIRIAADMYDEAEMRYI